MRKKGSQFEGIPAKNLEGFGRRPTFWQSIAVFFGDMRRLLAGRQDPKIPGHRGRRD